MRNYKMKHTKRILSLILVIAMIALALSSCNSIEQPESSETKKPAQTSKPTTSGDATTDPSNEEEKDEDNTEKLYSMDGNSVYFGSYPQSEVLDEALIAELNTMTGELPSLSNAQNWTSYGYYNTSQKTDYMWFIDVELGEETYRGVFFRAYRPHTNSYQASRDTSNIPLNGYTLETIYWFKWEPIKWTVLTQKDGSALLLCDMLIDAPDYGLKSRPYTEDDQTIYPSNYERSLVRTWLNDNFYNTAFTEEEQQIILISDVDNSAASTANRENQFICGNTQDKVFLLSYADVTNPEYGFSADTSASDTAKIKKPTKYAWVQGATRDSMNDETGVWWLRSPDAEYEGGALIVSTDGYAGANFDIRQNSIGVAPALKIKL